ncbi:unnamed protein product, partial [Ectocarpus sp. 12 AP-2014]
SSRSACWAAVRWVLSRSMRSTLVLASAGPAVAAGGVGGTPPVPSSRASHPPTGISSSFSAALCPGTAPPITTPSSMVSTTTGAGGGGGGGIGGGGSLPLPASCQSPFPEELSFPPSDDAPSTLLGSSGSWSSSSSSASPFGPTPASSARCNP